MAFGKTGFNNDSWPDYQTYFLSTHLGTDATIVYAQVQNINFEQVLQSEFLYNLYRVIMVVILYNVHISMSIDCFRE